MTRDELLERGDETVTLRQIVERFEAVEEEYSGVPWSLKQIYQQIDMLVSEKPCGDCISRKSVSGCVSTMYYKGLGKQKSLEYILKYVERLPSVSPAPKIGHWIKCIDYNGSSYYLCSECRCGEDFEFDFCPNCGSKNSE